MVKLAAPELVSGISGESEQRIRQVFQFAQVRKLRVASTALEHSFRMY